MGESRGDAPLIPLVRVTGREPFRESRSCSYKDIIAQDPRFGAWHTFHSKTLPEMLAAGREPELSSIVTAHVRDELGWRGRMPPVQWVTDEPVARAITGGQFAIPVLETGEDVSDVERIIQKGARGGIFEIPIEQLSGGSVGAGMSIDSRLFIVANGVAGDLIPDDEKRAHEVTHIIDPAVYQRTPDTLVMAELIGLIGSHARDLHCNVAELRLHRPYIRPYVINEMRMRGARVPSEFEIERQVALIQHLVSVSTRMQENGKKVPNDEVARRIMACRNLDELRRRWPEIFNYSPVV